MVNSNDRITLDLDADLKERLESVAAREGISLEQLCLRVLNIGLTLDGEKLQAKGIKADHRPHAELTRLRTELTGGTRKKPGSTDIIAAYRGYIDAIDMVFGDELDEYRDAELQRLLGKSQRDARKRNERDGGGRRQ